MRINRQYKQHPDNYAQYSNTDVLYA